jgi:hypothetical protein
MQQPPQYGYGQGPQGYPQQGYPPPGMPPPGYGPPPPGYPGYGPPKKKRTGLILGIIGGVVVLLGAGIPLGLFAKDYYASTGAAPMSSPAPDVCKVAPQTLEKAGTTSLVNGNVKDDSQLGLKQTGCGWRPPADENVLDRKMSLHLAEYSGNDPEESAKSGFLPGTPEEHPTEVKGIGDRAVLIRIVNDTAFSGSEIRVLQGKASFTVELSGWDKGFFSNSAIPPEESDAAVKEVAAEIAKKLPR